MTDRHEISLLLLAGIPPPVGGIATFTRHLLAEAERNREVEIELIDCSVHWRRMTQFGLALRLIGGSLHALVIILRVLRATAQKRFSAAQICSSGGLAFLRDLVVLRLLRWLGIPAILWFANDSLPEQMERRGPIGRLVRAVVYSASHIVVLDEKTKEFLARFPSLRVTRVPVFIRPDDVVAELKEPDRSADVVFIGWVIPTKGVEELVRACRSIAGVRLHLIGPVEEAYAEHLRRCGDEMAIDIRGVISREELIASLAGARALVLPSYGEGSPFVVLEAMALGKPVVATPVGAIPEMLGFECDTPCGIEVPVRDVERLATGIQTLLVDEELAAMMGSRAKARVAAHYSAECVFSTFAALWRSVASETQGDE